MPLLKDPPGDGEGEALLRSDTKLLEFSADAYHPHWDIDGEKDVGKKLRSDAIIQAAGKFDVALNLGRTYRSWSTQSFSLVGKQGKTNRLTSGTSEVSKIFFSETVHGETKGSAKQTCKFIFQYCSLQTLFAHDGKSQPCCSLGALCFKAICIGLAVCTIVSGHSVQGSKYFAYYSSWTVAVTFLYFLASLLDSLLTHRKLTTDKLVSTCTVQESHESLPTIRKAVWLLFEVSNHSGVAATLAFWAGTCFFALRGYPIYLNISIAPHGGLLLLTFIDGLMLNRVIHYRWSHWLWFILPFDVLYLTWTGIRGFLDLYMLDWQESVGTTIALHFILYVTSFVIFAALLPLNNCRCKFERGKIQHHDVIPIP